MSRISCVVVALLLCVGGVGQAQEASARDHFVSGKKHFDLAEYPQALQEFKDGYRAKEDPVFLFNIAQCYLAMNESKDALRYYRLYLNRSPNAENRQEVEAKIATLQKAIAEGPKAPVTATSTTAQAPSNPAPAAAVTASVEVPAQSKTDASRPVYKKWWLWTIVGVVAVGAGVGLGVGLGTKSTSNGSTFPAASF